MSKGLTIYLIILIILAAFIDFLVLKPTSLQPFTAQTFTLNSYRDTYIRSEASQINVISASDAYYRIHSGDTVLEGKYITGQHFQNSGILAPGHWIIDSGGDISLTLTADAPISIFVASTSTFYIEIIILTLIVVAMLYFIGYVISLE